MITAQGHLEDPRLAAIVAGLESTGWAAELCDGDWRLVWLSPQALTLMSPAVDTPGEIGLGVGRHVLESRRRPGWTRLVPPDAQRLWLAENVPQMLADAPGDHERLAELVPPDQRAIVMAAEPARLPVWTALIETTGVVSAIDRIRYFGVRVRAEDGTPLATLYVYGADLPATLLALVAQGDRGMFERMARLADPGPREAAVMFADIQSSGELSRHLSSSAYFRLVQALFSDLDRAVYERRGIVGKHAGDGLSAFFLSEDLGSAAAAAGAAIDAARAVAAAARATATWSDLPPAADLRINVGVHWGGALYMGQVVTGGRLEVTALGDEVNECARIQEAAREGTVLGSKALIERLDAGHAREIGIDPERVVYRTVAELPDAPAKAVRDAGAIPVAVLAEE